MERSTSRLSQWIYFLAAAFYYIAVFLRTLIIYNNTPELSRALVFLLLILLLFIIEPRISHHWTGFFTVYVLLQTALVFLLLALPGFSDF